MAWPHHFRYKLIFTFFKKVGFWGLSPIYSIYRPCLRTKGTLCKPYCSGVSYVSITGLSQYSSKNDYNPNTSKALGVPFPEPPEHGAACLQFFYSLLSVFNLVGFKSTWERYPDAQTPEHHSYPRGGESHFTGAPLQHLKSVLGLYRDRSSPWQRLAHKGTILKDNGKPRISISCLWLTQAGSFSALVLYSPWCNPQTKVWPS